MAQEPEEKRAVCFFDGQNLFHSTKTAFGYNFPNYDVVRLSQTVCAANGWALSGMRFYTGVPEASDKPHWHHFWTAKCAQMGREGVWVFTRSLKYRTKEITLADGSSHRFRDGDEKGIDVRLAIDIIRMGLRGDYDVAVVFSRDQDLSEVANEIKAISQNQNRWIKMASAYPFDPTVKHFRGVAKTQWIKLDRETYDKCIDTRDYRPKKP